MRIHRLVGIIMLLGERKIIKAKELSDILEASDRTIYRDIDILCEAGIPIVSIPGPYGGFSFMEGYKINPEALCKNDVINLLLSTMGIGAGKNTDASQEIKNIAIKLESSVSEEYKREIKSAREKFFCDYDPWFGESREIKYIDEIKKAVLNLKKIKIEYRKFAGESSNRIVRPYGAVVKNSEWYLAAYCESRKEIRIFKCSRIDSLEILEDTFEIPKDFKLNEFWKRSKERFIHKTKNNNMIKAYEVKLRLSEDERSLKGFNVLKEESEGKFLIKTIDMISLETASTVLFPISHRVKVIMPEELANFIKNRAMEIIKVYEDK